MNLQRLVEMIQQNRNGAEEWPVLFTSFIQNAAGEWQEFEGVRQPITTVEVERGADEVLLITDSDRQPLSLAKLVEELDRLMPCYGEFTVDSCETPIVLDDGRALHIDLPVVGVGRDEEDRCYLMFFASRVAN
jgi:hypothetical protein